MAPTVPEGHVGNLTPEQETKLRELWGAVFKLYEALEANQQNGDAKAEEAPKPETPKKTRWFGLRAANNDPAPTSKQSHAILEALKLQSDEDDKFGLVKQFQHVVTTHSPEKIRAMLLGAVKHENPDALALRFLRARKWDVNRGLVMMFSAMNWRSESKVDEDIMYHGEEGGAKDCDSGENMTKSMAKDFMFQMRMGKSYLHGVDREGRPISSVRVRLHKASDQCVESIERYTTYLIETTRFALDPPVETGTLIFDMTNFTLANMDYVPVKFIIKCFEANYPESLGAILLHNAPWVFKGIWKIIHGWLDPVVAGKVHFTYGKADLEKFIAPENIIKELGGDEDWEYKYEEPIAGENDCMKDTETRDRIQKERQAIADQYEAATREWVANATDEVRAKRKDLAEQLRVNYWQLDPYVRARSLYDRQGNFQGGKAPTKWYPHQDAAPVAEDKVAEKPAEEKVLEKPVEEKPVEKAEVVTTAAPTEVAAA